MSSAGDVMSTIKEHDVKFVDFRFTDTKGKEQHVTVPAHTVDKDLFEEGKMFDGSSIAGWKGINESDMILMPDPTTAVIDVFSEETTLNLRCDVIEPATMQGYTRDPRSLALRAEAYLKSTGIADTAFFGPEAEFFLFDDVVYDSGTNFAHYSVDSREGHWNTGRDEPGGNMGYKLRAKGGYFPCPPSDQLQDVRTDMMLRLMDAGIETEAQHHEVATGGQLVVELESNPSTCASRRCWRWRTRSRSTNTSSRTSPVATAWPRPSCPSRSSATTARACTAT